MNKANINRQLNCAIYTRKSTDEGLDKEFNSLDAQRELRRGVHQKPNAGRLALRARSL